MRADRLVSILMLLQSHGKMSARELAEKLEVSVRTIFRDLDALCVAGIPIYAEHGADGGYALVEGYRSGLTGLTNAEVRALILFKIPEPLEALEIGQNLKAARRKLAATLPGNPFSPRIYLDWKDWAAPAIASGRFETLYRAVHENLKIKLIYPAPNRMPVEQTVSPLGLVAKAGTWHLVWSGNGKTRCLPVTDLIEVELTGEPFDDPQGFDLPAFWDAHCAESEIDLFRFHVLVRASPESSSYLRRRPGACEFAPEPSDPQGWIRFDLAFECLEAARNDLLGWGGSVEVLEPEELRLSLLDYARQIARVYRVD